MVCWSHFLFRFFSSFGVFSISLLVFMSWLGVREGGRCGGVVVGGLLLLFIYLFAVRSIMETGSSGPVGMSRLPRPTRRFMGSRFNSDGITVTGVRAS